MELRPMELWDITPVAFLCEQFGYPASTKEVEERFQRLRGMSEHQVFIVESDSIVVGWIHVQGVHSLSSESYVEIRGIVVDDQYRKQGIGRELIHRAEQWAFDNGYRMVRLRSGTERPESHHFYPKLGYERTKTQYHYRKLLEKSSQ